jgi:hypothetical protein
MAHLATVVPIVRETEQSAWMKHASVVLVLPTLTTLTGEVEPRSEETEQAPVRNRLGSAVGQKPDRRCFKRDKTQ